MARFFLALPIAEDLQQQLSKVRITDDPHVRPVTADQLHLTLHFVGSAEVGSLIRSMANIRVIPFKLELDHLGSFGGPAKGGVLWIGCREHGILNHLHRELAAALHAAGIAVERRPFVPHISLARFEAGISRHVVDGFLAQTVPALPILRAERFSLFSSRQINGRHCYHEEATFPLTTTHTSHEGRHLKHDA